MKNSNFANMTWHLHYDVMSINAAEWACRENDLQSKIKKKNQSSFTKSVTRPSESYYFQTIIMNVFRVLRMHVYNIIFQL